MSLAKKIVEDLERLPEPQQAEVAGFVELLAQRNRAATEDPAEPSWTTASLAYALRGMEDEPDLYSLADLKEHFS